MMEGKDFRKIEIVVEALRRHKEFQQLLEGVNPFMIYRTDTGAVLARGIYGFEQAKAKANELRKRYGLKWEQVRFNADRSHTGSYKRQQGGRVEYSNRYNSSKRGHFRVRINPDGSTGDID
jgi:RecB family endonuclease NucS